LGTKADCISTEIDAALSIASESKLGALENLEDANSIPAIKKLGFAQFF
jgi:hypothetical protein